MIPHITVGELMKLLAELPPGVRIAPSVGNASLCIWSASDEEMIGTIMAAGGQYVVEMFEGYEPPDKALADAP